jgi:hypothetical protein
MSLHFCLSFRSAAEESAVGVATSFVAPRQPSCLSFRSAAEESAVGVAASFVAPPQPLSFRSAAEESAVAGAISRRFIIPYPTYFQSLTTFYCKNTPKMPCQALKPSKPFPANNIQVAF